MDVQELRPNGHPRSNRSLSLLSLSPVRGVSERLPAALQVFSRPEAQAEHDLVLASASKYSERWGPMLLVTGFASAVQIAMLCSFFMESSWSPEGRLARWPPPDPCFVILLAVCQWVSAARVCAAGDRLTSLAVGVSGARIPLKGMLGRTSWCNYFMSLPITIELPGGLKLNQLAVAQGIMFIMIPMMYLLFDPTTCEDGWFTCEGNEHLVDTTYVEVGPSAQARGPHLNLIARDASDRLLLV